MRSNRPALLGLALPLCFLTSAFSAQPPSLVERMLRAEDTRATGAALAPLQEGLAHRDAPMRQYAVRALGRLERAELIPMAAPLAEDPEPGVRAEAYNALGQLARDAGSALDVQTRLLARAKVEQHPVARSVLAATLGRLPYGAPGDARRAEALLVGMLAEGASKGSADALAGAAKGLESLVRLSRKTATPEPSTLEQLRSVAQLRDGADRTTLARVRRLAWLSLATLGAFDEKMIGDAATDDDEQVRRLTMVATGTGSDAPVERRAALLDGGLRDAAGPVRYEALRGWGKHEQSTSCAPVTRALGDASPHVALLAIDLLGGGCPAEPESGTSALKEIAEALPEGQEGWHRPAHAIRALAKVAPQAAGALLPRYVSHPVWQVRMYAAGAAGTLSAIDALLTLGRDPYDNVREAALDALLVLKRPEATSLALEALARRDYQLILTAARALGVQNPRLQPAPKTRAAEALTAALDRLTQEGRETSRDPRLAILDRVQELGWPDGASLGPGVSGALRARLRDFDPAVARKASEILGKWTGTPPRTAPQPTSSSPVSLSAVAALRGGRLRLSIAGRGQVELALLVDQAPLTSLRVATLVRDRYYDGLTFHRVAPNFVIQGGSPGANEYMGDGPYMRDEVGVPSHLRGTVGISTRGRDTGDAQLFINLVDSPRLDHTYTVFAEVVQGMNVVDSVVEGDVIERVELITSAKP